MKYEYGSSKNDSICAIGISSGYFDFHESPWASMVTHIGTNDNLKVGVSLAASCYIW